MTETIFRPIRILLVANHPMICRALGRMLMVFDHLQYAGRAESGEAAIQLCAERLPDVILMDMDLESLDDEHGPTFIHIIHQKFPQVWVIALANFEDDKLIKQALENGVSGYLLKDASANQIDRAIRAAVSGRVTISAQAVQALFEILRQKPNPGHTLTKREREILALMIDGLDNTQIAGKLICSPSIIKMNIRNILAKLRFTSRARSVTIAMPNRIASVDYQNST